MKPKKFDKIKKMIMVTRLSQQSPGTWFRAQGSNLDLGTHLSPSQEMALVAI